MHAAALIVVPESVAEPRALLPRERGEVARPDLARDPQRLPAGYLFSSSASIYAPGADFTVDETSPLRPESPYARTKAVMEWVLEDCTNAYDLRVISLRYFNPIGADPKMRTGLQHAKPSHLLGRLITALEAGEEFHITGTDWPTRDGSGIRDFIHVWDLARAHVEALRRFDEVLPAGGDKRYDVLNLGTGTGTTVREFVAAFQRVADRPLRVADAPSRPGDVVGSYTRTDKARAALDWTPDYTIEDGIRHSLEWATHRPERPRRVTSDLGSRPGRWPGRWRSGRPARRGRRSRAGWPRPSPG